MTLLNVADRISDLYPELDRDLLLTGIFLHDIGKVDELSYDRAFAYTDEGQLVGHLVMGVEMLAREGRAVRRPDGRAVPARAAAAAQAHDRQPPRHLRVRQPEAADDPRGDRAALAWTTSTPRSTPSAARSATTPAATRAGRRSSRAWAAGCSRGAAAVGRVENADAEVGDTVPRQGRAMPTFRISISALLAIIAVIAIGLAGMVSASTILDRRRGDRRRSGSLLSAVLAARLLDGPAPRVLDGFRPVRLVVPVARQLGLDRRPVRARPLRRPERRSPRASSPPHHLPAQAPPCPSTSS